MQFINTLIKINNNFMTKKILRFFQLLFMQMINQTLLILLLNHLFNVKILLF